MKKQAKEWIKFAKTDLQATIALITEENLSPVAAFHTQQCVEKSLKALLELNNKKVPRTHDLIKLLQRIEEEKININMKINEEVLDQISQVYIDTRYPADFGLLPEGKPSINKVKEFLDEAESIFNQTVQLIEKYQEK
jgi:HEPN domain-containing protein